jgi:cytidine deaminase
MTDSSTKGAIAEKIWKKACGARDLAYAPYSKFQVGSAIETDSGEFFCGTNVENASYGGTVCAERIAIFKAVSEGFKKFKRIAVVSELNGKAVPPCGMCLQVIAEFCGPETEIILATPSSIQKIYKLSDLLPVQFKLV